MKTNKIKTLLTNFENNNQKSFIVDGPWGVGKTYQINEYLKSKRNNNLEIIYISLFGKRNIDEIHTEIYSKIHPKISLIKNSIPYISPAIQLIPYVGDSLNNSLNLLFNDTSKPNNLSNKNKKKYIVILDDLERVDEDFKYVNLLGYVNQLFLSGIKVAAICNSEAINESAQTDFQNFKEKIFDRQYKITEADKDVIISFFIDNTILDDRIIELYDNNLRTASKSNVFFNEICEHINLLTKNKNNDSCLTLTKKEILWYASLIVSRFNMKLSMEKYQKRYEQVLNIPKSHIENLFSDKTISDSLLYIYYENCDKKYITRPTDSLSLLEAFALIYYYDDFSLFDDLIIKKQTEEKKYDIFDECVFYKSTDDKKNYIKKILEIIAREKKEITIKEVNVLKDIFSYRNLFPTDYDENSFSDKLANLLIESPERVISHLKIGKFGIDDFKNFVSLTLQKYETLLINQSINNFESAIAKKDLTLINQTLLDFQTKYYCKKSTIDGYLLADEINTLFKTHNYYLPDIKENITDYEWSLCTEISSFLNKYEIRTDYISFLESLKNKSNDFAELERIDVLLKEFLKKD